MDNSAEIIAQTMEGHGARTGTNVVDISAVPPPPPPNHPSQQTRIVFLILQHQNKSIKDPHHAHPPHPLALPNGPPLGTILPFRRREQDGHCDTRKMDVDLDSNGDARSRVLYTPSFILSLPISVSSSIHNLIDFVFPCGFHNPTIAVLYSGRPTWTCRLKEAKDTWALVIFPMSMSTMSSASATSFSAYGLDCLRPCPPIRRIIMSIKNLLFDAQVVRGTWGVG
ncbi:hypothetical protein GYMLUDRAFT_250123 [Collybiopsis luxurians FD-317 M1]|uniref:Uncharacterized protein n=1 Tax=Collybiopsis luxurians FD-317 M1 TaxID=944289 RepID=A0A0D0BVV5_9AGAR|nr:hypothetical protein GYMLUDRAFT_250123 [Collybiopsis luxurians FD-317 M1]